MAEGVEAEAAIVETATIEATADATGKSILSNRLV
jgi:hypothetical protein